MELLFYGLTKFLLHWDIVRFYFVSFCQEALGIFIELSQDFMAFCVVVVVAIALFRRIVIPKPRLLPSSKDAETILWLIGFLYLTFFIYIPTETAMRVGAGELPQVFILASAGKFEFGHAYVRGAASCGPCGEYFGFWTHLAIFLGFAVYIPRS